jgi:hypothetical protein
MARLQALVIVSLLLMSGCNFRNRGLVINEVMTSNDNAWHDEWGEDEDYIEVANTADHAIRLGGYVITDGSGKRARLPDVELPAGQVYMLIADAAPEQGPQHLPFRISSTGDVLVLGDAHGFAVERLEVPALAINATLQRFPNGKGELTVCDQASPARDNGTACVAAPSSKQRSGPRDD